MAVNKCIFIGRLTDDPSVRYMPNGDPVANFSIAVNEKYKDKSGEQREKTEYIRVVAYRRKLQTRKWTDNNGVERYTTEIIADSVQLLDSRRDDQDGQQGYQQQGYQQQQRQQHNPPPQQDFDDVPF